MPGTPRATAVYDTYWRFAAERQAVYYRRMAEPRGPWSADPIINAYRFTNAYRVADRVSQYLVRNVQYAPDRSQEPAELCYRTLLFKIFNRSETWATLERALGPISSTRTPPARLATVLDQEFERGTRIYSAAYIMPSPPCGQRRKHRNHLALLARMMADELPRRLADADSLEAAYHLLLAYPGIGPFLAFQYSIDLNYSTLLNFDENDFVVAGPGALDGIAKCFEQAQEHAPEEIIRMMVARQHEEFERRGLRFDGLYGRPLQPIDCQNLFCEVSKYARIAHPDVPGISGRTRIKQRYRPATTLAPTPAAPFLPPQWGMDTSRPVSMPAAPVPPADGADGQLGMAF